MGLFDLFSSGNEQKAMQAQIGGINRGRTAAYGAIDQGVAGLGQQYDQAGNYLQPYADVAGRATTSYADALGLNGAGGVTNAQNQFQTGPGYGFALQEGEQAALRAASAGGMLASGNTLAELQRRGQGIANQEWGGYLDRLQGLNQQGVGIAGRQGDIRTGYGDRLYDSGLQKGQIGWNAATGIGGAQAGYQNSKDQAGANIFNSVTGGLTLGAKMLGLGGFGGGLGRA